MESWYTAHGQDLKAVSSYGGQPTVGIGAAWHLSESISSLSWSGKAFSFGYACKYFELLTATSSRAMDHYTMHRTSETCNQRLRGMRGWEAM